MSNFVIINGDSGVCILGRSPSFISPAPLHGVVAPPVSLFLVCMAVAMAACRNLHDLVRSSVKQPKDRCLGAGN